MTSATLLYVFSDLGDFIIKSPELQDSNTRRTAASDFQILIPEKRAARPCGGGIYDLNGRLNS